MDSNPHASLVDDEEVNPRWFEPSEELTRENDSEHGRKKKEQNSGGVPAAGLFPVEHRTVDISLELMREKEDGLKKKEQELKKREQKIEARVAEVKKKEQLEREKEFQAKEAALKKKEQELMKKDKELEIKELELEKKQFEVKEAVLNEKEQELKRREDAIARAGIIIEEKNWPPFFPLIHHDIANEIPVHLQMVQYHAFTALLGIIVCLLWNVVAVTVACFNGEGPAILFLSIFYLISGVAGVYVLWYRPLYRATRTGGVFKFGWFFMGHVFLVSFCTIATIGPPIFFEGRSLAGFVPAFDLLAGKPLVAKFYFVGSTLFFAELLISCLWLLMVVHRICYGCCFCHQMPPNEEGMPS